MKKLILFLLTAALLILPLSGCFADNKQNEETTPNNTTPETTTPEETTHDIIYPDPPEPRYAMSAQTPTEWEIANGDIPISLSFGLKEYCSVDDMFSNIVIYLVNSEDQTHVFKKIDIAEIEKPEYVVEYVYDEERQVVGFNYAHTETVNLPLSLFSEDSGFVQILMRDWVDDGTDEGQYGAGGGTILYYKRNGETTLIISDKPIQESTTPDNPPEVTTPEPTTPPEDNQNDPPVVEGELDKDSELIVELIAYLEQYLVEYDLISISFSGKVNGIKNGAQPLHVAFDPNNYYFVGGYYNTTHENSVIDYCYASEYVWVGYESETEIQEYYNGMPCVVVFQINRALTVTNILSGEPANDMEHFQIYKPTFENGVNIGVPVVFDKTFIYLNNFINHFDEDTIYHSTSWYYHPNITISCICLDSEYYLPFYLATLEDGEIFDAQQALSTDQITYTLGDYYDAIINIMNTDKYNVEVNEKYTYRYGVVSIDDFVNSIFG